MPVEIAAVVALVVRPNASNVRTGIAVALRLGPQLLLDRVARGELGAEVGDLGEREAEVLGVGGERVGHEGRGRGRRGGLGGERLGDGHELVSDRVEVVLRGAHWLFAFRF